MNFNEELAVAGTLELTDSELETTHGSWGHRGGFGGGFGGFGFGGPEVVYIPEPSVAYSSPCDAGYAPSVIDPYAYAYAQPYPFIGGFGGFGGFGGRFGGFGRHGGFHHGGPSTTTVAATGSNHI